MTMMRNRAFGKAWMVAALLALACAGCAAPVTDPVEPLPVAAKSTRVVAPAKEPVPPPRSEAPPAVMPAKRPGNGEQALEKGVQGYEDGEYKSAAKQLQTALDLGLDTKRDQARAHKYLAFINCRTGREKSCRDEFNKALDADPKFDLEPAEAGHPIWGPALRSVKAERAGKAKPK